MGWFITAIIVAVIGAIFLVVAIGLGRIAKNDDDSDARFWRNINAGIATVLLLIAGLFVMFATVYSQSVGEAKVIVDVSGKRVGTDTTPGWGTKAPWEEAVDFDLFSQEVLYAGGDQAPSYSGGTVNGKEVTVSVGGINGGSTTANVDVSIVYSLDADSVESIYDKNRSQERFTKQIVEKTILSAIRQVPSQYSAIEFRGEKRGEAASKMEDKILDELSSKGIIDVIVNLQDIRYSETVESALNDVENANQAVQKAEADQRKVEVEAETARIKAQGVADANAILNSSLTDAVLAQKYIDALKEGTVYVVPEGSTPFIGTR